jgi:hypothetical protein
MRGYFKCRNKTKHNQIFGRDMGQGDTSSLKIACDNWTVHFCSTYLDTWRILIADQN